MMQSLKYIYRNCQAAPTTCTCTLYTHTHAEYIHIIISFERRSKCHVTAMKLEWKMNPIYIQYTRTSSYIETYILDIWNVKYSIVASVPR